MTVTINANCGLLGSTTVIDSDTSVDSTSIPPPDNVLSAKLEESLSENVASLLERLSIDSVDDNEEPLETKDYCFVFKDDNHLVSNLSGTVLKDNLYIEFPDGKMPVGSRECFVMLLDFAEETLEVSSVILCLPKHQIEEAEILRAFMYLGFEVVHNSTCEIVPATDAYIFMAYGFE